LTTNPITRHPSGMDRILGGIVDADPVVVGVVIAAVVLAAIIYIVRRLGVR